MTMTYDAFSGTLQTLGRAAPALFGAPAALLGALMLRLLRWQQRARERDQLAKLDDRALRDLGLTRVQLWREIHKPFWQE